MNAFVEGKTLASVLSECRVRGAFAPLNSSIVKRSVILHYLYNEKGGKLQLTSFCVPQLAIAC